MNVVTNRNGQDRSYEFIRHNLLRISGESVFLRTSVNKRKEITFVDFEGGPRISLKSKFNYKGMEYNVTSINVEQSPYFSKNHPDMVFVQIGLNPKY